MITIGSTTATPTNITASDFMARSTAAADPIAEPTGIFVSIAVAVAITDAETTIGAATITTTGDTTILASSNTDLNVVAINNLKDGAAIAVSVTSYTTGADVQPGATINAGGNISVQANTIFVRQTLARTVTGPEGFIGVAIAVDVAIGSSNAYLDGKACAGLNVNVTATEMTTTQTGFLYLSTSQYGYGVTASAGTGLSTSGNFFYDTKSAAESYLTPEKVSALTGSASAWFKNKLGLDGPSEPTTFQAAGAFTVDVITFSSTARIGDGVSSDAATVAGDTGVNVLSSVTSTPNLGAGATADSTQQNQQAEQNKTQTVDYGVALAVDVGVFTNTATAYIAGNATVNSGGPLVVTSDPNNIFNPANTELTNLLYPFENDRNQATYNSSSGFQNMMYGNTVDVESGYQNGGVAGKTYEYVGPDNDRVNLGTTNYANPNNWTPYDIAENSEETFLSDLTGYLDGNAGISNFLATSTTSAVAVGQKTLSVAGSISVMLLENNSTATIDSGAQINQNTAFRGAAQQSVLVQAENENDSIHVVGNFQTPGITGDLGQKSLKPSPTIGLGGVGAGGSGTAAGVGVAVLVLITTANTTAQIQDGVILYADDLGVLANNKTLGVAIGLSGGKSSNFGFNGVVLYNRIDDRTIASVGARASVTVGSAHVIEPGTSNPFTNVTAPPFDSDDSTLVEANDDVNLITGAGSIALGQKAGVGASIALNYLDRDTEAYIGNAYTASSGPTSGSFQSGGPIAIDATNTGYVYAVAVAGAVAQKPDPASSAGNSNPPAAPVDSALDLAVAVAVNTISDGDLAYINGATVQSSGGISLDAEETPYFDTFTIGGSVNTTAGQSGIALAGAFSFNDIDGLTVESFITQSGGAQRHGDRRQHQPDCR